MITETPVVYWRGTTMSRQCLAVLEMLSPEKRDSILEQFSHIELVLEHDALEDNE